MRPQIGDSPMKRVRIAVDANPGARPSITGTELYAREVAARLPKLAPDLEWTFYSSRPGPPGRTSLDFTVLPFPRLWSQARLPVELMQRPPDLLFAPSHVIPFLSRGAALTVVHDLAFERFPQAYRWREQAYLRLTTRWAEHRCRQLLAVSNSTRQDLAAIHGVDPARVSVVHPGGGEPLPPADPDLRGDADALQALGLDREFVLHVGRVEPRKNQLAALRAAERLPDLLFVSVGSIEAPAMARAITASSRGRLLGRVGEGTRDLLYRNALALCFPSLYEGFGFPVLEAMRSGLPVVTVRASSLPEVAGEAALYVERADDIAGLAHHLQSLRQDSTLRERLRHAGRDRAAHFTWDRCAEGVTAVIRSLVG